MQTKSFQSLSERVRQMATPDIVYAPEADSPKERVRKSFIVADIANSPRNDSPVCPSCANLLSQLERQRVSAEASRDECIICAVEIGKPEAYTEPFCSFLTNNPTVFHAVEYFKGKLSDSGFTEVRSGHSNEFWIDLFGQSNITFVFYSFLPTTNG
jgi:aminopeptidase I